MVFSNRLSTKLVSASCLSLALIAASGVALARTSLDDTKAAPTQAASQNLVQIAAGNKDFSTLVAAVKAAGLAEALSGPGPFTIFAPTNEAFAKLPAGTVETLLKPENKAALTRVLTYHVVGAKVPAADAVKLTNAATLSGQRLDLKVVGSDLMVDGAKVIKADIFGSNGVIHVVDSVLLPTDKDIVDTAAAAGSFKTLIAAAQAAGLVDVLKDDKALTVLAPTDEAFAKLPKGTLESLLKPENKAALATVLKLHVIDGRVFSDAAMKMGEGKSLSGESLKFSASGGKASVNNAGIIKTDIDASNGVIHVIDTVLLPAKMPKLTMGLIENGLSPREIAALAINRGAPMFNDGKQHECAAVYEVACQSLVAMESVPDGVKSELRSTLAAASNEHHAGEKAWTLRRGLDKVMEMQTVSSN